MHIPLRRTRIVLAMEVEGGISVGLTHAYREREGEGESTH